MPRSEYEGVGFACTSAITSSRACGPSHATNFFMSNLRPRRVPLSSRRPTASGAARMRNDWTIASVSASSASSSCAAAAPTPPRGSGAFSSGALNSSRGGRGGSSEPGAKSCTSAGTPRGRGPMSASSSYGSRSPINSWKMNANGGGFAPPLGLMKPISSFCFMRTLLPLPTFWWFKNVPLDERS